MWASKIPRSKQDVYLPVLVYFPSLSAGNTHSNSHQTHTQPHILLYINLIIQYCHPRWLRTQTTRTRRRATGSSKRCCLAVTEARGVLHASPQPASPRRTPRGTPRRIPPSTHHRGSWTWADLLLSHRWRTRREAGGSVHAPGHRQAFFCWRFC